MIYEIYDHNNYVTETPYWIREQITTTTYDKRYYSDPAPAVARREEREG